MADEKKLGCVLVALQYAEAGEDGHQMNPCDGSGNDDPGNGLATTVTIAEMASMSQVASRLPCTAGIQRGRLSAPVSAMQSGCNALG